MVLFKVFLFIFLLASVNASGKGFGPGEQDYAYVTVRPGAHMFWWLYHTTANVTDSAERPLLVWLAGGPGGSSCGIGNFYGVGPLDVNLEPREYTWVKDYNVLFIDNPVGAGYSYVENSQQFVNNNTEIGLDLFEVMKAFYERNPKFKTTPLYIYGISYGGKMAVEIAKLLYDENKAGNIESNIKGVFLGNAWISPVDSTIGYSPYLYEVSLIDDIGAHLINEHGKHIEELYGTGHYFHVTLEWFRMQNLIWALTDGLDMYNVLTKMPRFFGQEGRSFNEQLVDKLTFNKFYSNAANAFDDLMNGPVKEALDIPSYVVWGGQSHHIMENLFPDFMMPITETVEYLLENTDIEVHVCNGNLDAIVNTPGTLNWIKNLKWKDSEEYFNAPRETIWVNNTLEGYKRQGGRLSLYWINVAGHDHINDNPVGTWAVLKYVMGEA